MEWTTDAWLCPSRSPSLRSVSNSRGGSCAGRRGSGSIDSRSDCPTGANVLTLHRSGCQPFVRHISHAEQQIKAVASPATPSMLQQPHRPLFGKGGELRFGEDQPRAWLEFATAPEKHLTSMRADRPVCQCKSWKLLIYATPVGTATRIQPV
jgi:hypothetical protein